MNFKKYLTPEEREQCWRVGFVRKMAACGKRPSDFGFEKKAFLGEGLGKAMTGLSDALLAAGGLSLAAGLPIGIFLHLADKSMTSDRKKTKELIKQRDVYQDAIAQLRSQLAASGEHGK